MNFNNDCPLCGKQLLSEDYLTYCNTSTSTHSKGHFFIHNSMYNVIRTIAILHENYVIHINLDSKNIKIFNVIKMETYSVIEEVVVKLPLNYDINPFNINSIKHIMILS